MNRWVQIAFLHTCQHLSLVFFMVTMLTGELLISVVLICISLISAVDHCSMYLLATCVSQHGIFPLKVVIFHQKYS